MQCGLQNLPGTHIYFEGGHSVYKDRPEEVHCEEAR